MSIIWQEHYRLMNQVRKFYFGDEQAASKVFEYISDINFALGIDKSVKLHSKHKTVNTYYMW